MSPGRRLNVVPLLRRVHFIAPAGDSRDVASGMEAHLNGIGLVPEPSLPLAW